MIPNQNQSAEIYRELRQLHTRDWQLWSICALVIVVIAIGFAAFLLPNLVWASAVLHSDHRYFPQLFFGLIVLIVLFNVYILDQKRALNRAQAEMLCHLVESTEAKQVAIIDPLTSVFNRRYMDEAIPREVSRAQRAGTEISFLIIDLDDFKEINTRLGHFGGDQYLRDFTSLLKKTFRGSDTVLRMGGDEFLIILPETGNPQAYRAAERLQWETKWWNQAGQANYQISFSCGIGTFKPGMDVHEILKLADEDLYRVKKERKARPSNLVLLPAQTCDQPGKSMTAAVQA
jgi:diguanylate cyclase (GGDEF)-like protein